MLKSFLPLLYLFFHTQREKSILYIANFESTGHVGFWVRSINRYNRLMFVKVVCPSVSMENLGSHLTDFNKFWFVLFENLLRNSCSLTSDKNNVYITCKTYIYIYMAVSRSVILRIRNVSVKVVDKPNARIMIKNFLNNRAVYGIMRKIFYIRAGHRWQYGSCALHARSLGLKINTQNK